MKIRKATKEDANELIKLIQIADNRTERVARKKVGKFIDSKKGFFIVAVEKSIIIGYLLFVVNEEDEFASRFLDINNYGCVCWVAVHPNFRRKCVGSLLLKEALIHAKEFHKEGAWLDCRESVVSFYANNGFKEVGQYEKETPSGILKPCHIMAGGLR